jgi:hypothetical protein
MLATCAVDARSPGLVLGRIPGAQPVARQPGTVPGGGPTVVRWPGIVNAPGGGLTARRIGNAWIVVRGGSGLAGRLQALGALKIAKLDLRQLRWG